jgi:hypothetical protein
MYSRRSVWRVPHLLVLFAIGGCASAELNSNTLDLASTTNDLMMHQVFYNLSNFIDSDLAYPAQAVISGGTASTTDSLAANVSTPLSTAITTTNAFASTAAAAITTSATGTAQNVLGAATFGASGTGLRSQNWAYAPITDAFRARRLMALYRYAVTGDDDTLLHDYPKIYQSVSHNRNTCLAMGHYTSTKTSQSDVAKLKATAAEDQEAAKKAGDNFNAAKKAAEEARKVATETAKGGVKSETAAAENDATSKEKAAEDANKDWQAKKSILANDQAKLSAATGTVLTVDNFNHCITSYVMPGNGPQVQPGSDSYTTMRPDPYYLQRPSCVVCWRYSKLSREPFVYVNPDLKGRWLHWRALPGATKPDNYGPYDVSLGYYGHYELFAAAGQEQKAPKFALFALAAATQSDTGGGAAGGAGGGAAGGAAPKAAELPPAPTSLFNFPGNISVPIQ